MSSELIPANSPSFEYVYVANQRCECGGWFTTLRQELHQTSSGPVDRIIARCDKCSTERSFDFDIHTFFAQFDKYARFLHTEAQFREAMDHIRAGRLSDAASALRQVVDPEEGEPAFAWAHYHLARVLLLQGQTGDALVHLEQAAAIQPLEPEMHQVLGETLQAAGRTEAGQEHLQQAAGLRERFGEEGAG